MKRPLSVAAALVLAIACSDQSPAGPQTAISDGAHEDADHPGNPDFFFLPPMVGDPSGHPDFEFDKFNGSLAPTVRICELEAADAASIEPETPCSSPQPSGFPIVFTTTTGPGSETIGVNTTGKHYAVNWHTDLLPLSATRFYRVQVTVGTFPLGFADVDVVNNGSGLKNVQTGELIGLVDGRTLPIKFRIEEDALCTPEPGEECNASSETVDLGDGGQVELRDETTGDQIGVLTIQPQQTDVQVTFTLEQCQQLDIDIAQFGDCLQITADPPLEGEEGVVPEGLDPPATISICRLGELPERNPLITLHRQDDAGNVYALPHADDDCEDLVPGPGQQGPAWDVGQQPAGDSPFTSLFRNALPAKMDYVSAGDAERTASAGDPVTFSVNVTDANGAAVTGGDPAAQVRFTVSAGGTTTPLPPVPVVNGMAQVTVTIGAGATTVTASGHGIATPGNNGPAEGFDPFWPGLHEEGVEKFPVLLGTGTLEFLVSTSPTVTETVDLSDGAADQVELTDQGGNQIGVLTIPAGQAVEAGQSGQITFTLELCEALDADIPQFGDCLRITSDPPLTTVVGADGLNPPATISLCRVELIGPQNDLMTVHRQDETTGEVFALPHTPDDCDDVVITGPSRGPQWDVGQQPAGDSPFTSLFRNGMPVQMDPLAGTDGQTAAPGQAVAIPPGVMVADRNGAPAPGATVHFEVTAGNGAITPFEVVSDGSGHAQLNSWQLGTLGSNTVRAFGKGIAGPGDQPFMPDLPTDEGPGAQEPVLLETGEAFFTATATEPDGSVIFRATFTNDAVDAQPGAPEVGAWTTIDESAGTVRVRSAVGDLTNKPVELNQATGLFGGVDLGGTVAGTPPTTGRWLVRWRSLINSADAFFAPIVLRGSGGAIIASVEYRAGGQLTYNSPTNDIGIDWTQGASQLFEIVVDLDAQVTDLYVNGSPVSSQQDVAFVGAATSLQQIGAELGGTFAQIFAWDDVDIRRATVIDGVLSPGEWDGAATIDFNANVPGGGTTPARLFVMNNGINLYLAVRFERAVVDADNLLNFEFDNNNNGTGPENGDDYVTFSFASDPNQGVFADAYRSGGGASVTNDGINHGEAAFTNNGVVSVYEMAHPLNSGETGQDFALVPPATVGMLLQLTVGSAHTVHPTGTFPTYVQINITSP